MVTITRLYYIYIAYNVKCGKIDTMEKQKPWIRRARECLQDSLNPVPHELNELDWKLTLSENSERVAQHMAAFANHSKGGFFVFGIESSGTVTGISKEETKNIIHKIGILEWLVFK